MELRQAKETMKRLGLNRHHNPIVKGLTLDNKKELVDFAVLTIETGISHVGPLYRVNIFIIKNDGKFTLLFNDCKEINLSGDVDNDFVGKYSKVITDEDCIVIYETDKEKYKVIGQK